jgi:hypothetical protein
MTLQITSPYRKNFWNCLGCIRYWKTGAPKKKKKRKEGRKHDMISEAGRRRRGRKEGSMT